MIKQDIYVTVPSCYHPLYTDLSGLSEMFKYVSVGAQEERWPGKLVSLFPCKFITSIGGVALAKSGNFVKLFFTNSSS